MECGQEQRLTGRLLKYWNLVRKTCQMPEMGHFNIEPVRDIWPLCFAVSVDNHHVGIYKYEYVGHEITATYGRDVTGEMIDRDVKRFPGVVMHKKINDVAHERRPMEDDGYFISEEGKLIKYRACFLPFGTDAKGVTHIVVGLSFRRF